MSITPSIRENTRLPVLAEPLGINHILHDNPLSPRLPSRVGPSFPSGRQTRVPFQA
jgi:hypothetical protein